MPYVEVKVAGRLQPKQKESISKGITKLLKDIANKEPQTTYVVISEISRDNWSVAGESLTKKSS